MKNFCNKVKLACTEHPNYLAAVITALFLVLILAVAHHAQVAADPMSGVYESYDQVEGEDLDQLIENYYKYYGAGNVDALEKIANPISKQEASYIKFLSQYTDKYSKVTVYSKRGADDDSYLVSATMNLKFKNIKTAIPGMDFFYVKTNKNGKLYIDNTYGSFNQSNNVYPMDQQITALISAFEQQDDVQALQKKVQEETDQACKKDADLNTFYNKTLEEDISKWAASYAKENASSSTSSQSSSSSSSSASQSTSASSSSAQ